MSYFNLRSSTFDQPRGDPKNRLGTKAIQRCGVTETTVNGGRIRPSADLDAELEQLPSETLPTGPAAISGDRLSDHIARTQAINQACT
jgi:hypothetical protein